MTLDGRAVLASHDQATDLLTVWSATQTPHICQRTIADLLERELPSVQVIAPFVGGGFGTKAPFYAEEIVIPVAALKLGCPVKWIEDRREHFLSATMERDQYWKVAIAVDRDGRILGLRGAMIHDNGAYLPWGIIAPYIASTTFPGSYVVPAFRFETTVVLTNRVPTTVVRGAGRPQAVFAMERLMDRVARELAIDRAEVRRRNMVGPERMPYSVGLVFRDGKPLVYASGDRRRQLRGGHRAWAVRRRHGAHSAQRPGHGRDRRRHAGPGHPHHAVANRRRSAWRPDRGCRRDRRRHQCNQPGRRRFRQPAGHQCREFGDARGR
jgi:carbon-monoxide dehydrogenase large subunit